MLAMLKVDELHSGDAQNGKLMDAPITAVSPPEKNLKVSVDGNGKIHPMLSTEVDGTLLVISEPA